MPPHNHTHHSHGHGHSQRGGIISKQPLGTAFPRHVHAALARYEKDQSGSTTYTAAWLWRMRTAAFKASEEAAKAQAAAKLKPPVPVFSPEEPTVPSAATRFRLGERVTLHGMDLVQYNGQSGVVQHMEGSKLVLKFDSGKVARVCCSRASPAAVTPASQPSQDEHIALDLDEEWMEHFGDEALDIFAGTLDGDGIDLDGIGCDKSAPRTEPAAPTKPAPCSKLAHLGAHFHRAVQPPGKACRLEKSTQEPTTSEQPTSGSTDGDVLDVLLNDWFDGEFSSDCLQMTA